jgi:hypothetical protein
MTALEEAVSAVLEAQRLAQEKLPALLAALKDTSRPLAERWTAYTALVNSHVSAYNKTYGDGFVSVLGENVTLYDSFHLERYTTTTFVEMYQQIIEADESSPELVAARETNLEAWQEAVLASGYSSFTYDW